MRQKQGKYVWHNYVWSSLFRRPLFWDTQLKTRLLFVTVRRQQLYLGTIMLVPMCSLKGCSNGSISNITVLLFWCKLRPTTWLYARIVRILKVFFSQKKSNQVSLKESLWISIDPDNQQGAWDRTVAEKSPIMDMCLKVTSSGFNSS